MKTHIALVLTAALGVAGAVFAQPSGGPDAKGNAPLKASHTVNDGAAKPGANSFTQGQAREHILNSGYSSVSALNKGSDGVWRGLATKDGASVNVALDFKGNVSEAAQPVGATAAHVRAAGTGAMENSGPAPAAGGAGAVTHRHSHHRRHPLHSHGVNGEKMDGQGAAISGVDRNNNGISDKEDRALKH